MSNQNNNYYKSVITATALAQCDYDNNSNDNQSVIGFFLHYVGSEPEDSCLKEKKKHIICYLVIGIVSTTELSRYNESLLYRYNEIVDYLDIMR